MVKESRILDHPGTGAATMQMQPPNRSCWPLDARDICIIMSSISVDTGVNGRIFSF